MLKTMNKPKQRHTTVKLTVERHQQALAAWEKDCVRSGKIVPFQEWIDKVVRQGIEK